MKELSIEEKAKRYDEAIERARTEYKKHEAFKGFCEMLVNIFPELAESDDERIRKALIDLIKCNERSGHTLLNNVSTSSMLAWLEKQGNNANKVESIFEVGKWIVVNKSKYTFLVKRGAPRFQVEDTKGDIYSFYLLPNGEEEYHLWTIQDAKDGDVLHSPSHHLIWIYKDNENYHACINMNYTTNNITTNWLISIPNDVRPATKDEQTILFERMKEAGYEWDADKKELKKTEQTTEIPFGAKDSELQEATYHIPDGYHAEINGNEVVIKKGEQKTTWKPTEEQIEALEHLLETIRRHEYSYFHEEKFLLLHSLLEQLKEL